MRATVTGMPLLTSEGTRRSLAAIHRAELIALPLLFIALLLVFRSPLAAAIPAAFGAATIAASTGALALLAGIVRLDAFALAISCMVGLALAVDYSLLMVSRVREELADGRRDDIEPPSRAPPPRRCARSRVAAAAIVVAMGVAAAVSPGTGLIAAAARRQRRRAARGGHRDPRRARRCSSSPAPPRTPARRPRVVGRRRERAPRPRSPRAARRSALGAALLLLVACIPRARPEDRRAVGRVAALRQRRARAVRHHRRRRWAPAGPSRSRSSP